MSDKVVLVAHHSLTALFQSESIIVLLKLKSPGIRAGTMTTRLLGASLEWGLTKGSTLLPLSFVFGVLPSQALQGSPSWAQGCVAADQIANLIKASPWLWGQREGGF